MTRRANHNLTLLQTAISHIYLKAKVGAGGGDVTWQVTYKRFRYKIKYRKKDLHEWFSSPAICRLKEGMSASNNWPTSYPEQRTEFLSYTVPMRQWLLYFHSFLSCIHRCFQFVRHSNFTSQNIWYTLLSPGVSLPASSVYFAIFSQVFLYSLINLSKSPVSGAGKISEPRLMSQDGRVREFVCAQISVFLESEHWRCQYWSVYVAAAVMWLR